MKTPSKTSTKPCFQQTQHSTLAKTTRVGKHVACDARVGQCLLHAYALRSLPVPARRSLPCLDVVCFGKDFRHRRHLAGSYEDSLRTRAGAQGSPLEEAAEEEGGVVSQV